MLPTSTQANATVVGEGVSGLTVAVTTCEIVTVASLTPPAKKRNDTLFVPAVAPAHPFAERNVYVIPAAWFTVVKLCAPDGDTVTPAGKVPRVTAIADPPVPIAGEGFTTIDTDAPGPLAVLQVNVADAGVAVNAACKLFPGNTDTANNKHAVERRLLALPTLVRGFTSCFFISVTSFSRA